MRAAFFDIDGTLTNDRTWKGFLDYFQQHNLRRGTHAVFLALHYPLYFLFRLRIVSATTFRGVWAANMAWYVRGYSIQEAEAVWDWTVTEFLNHHWRADTRAILDDHHRKGDLVILVSSGPQPLIQRAARELGADHAIGTRLATRNGRYTGRSLKPTCIDTYKATLPQDYLEKASLDVDLDESFAYADSITDLPLLEMVGHPTAVYPDAKLGAIAAERGWHLHPKLKGIPDIGQS
jgi:HAD superfamily hydrolase (TIGR01490 family)